METSTGRSKQLFFSILFCSFLLLYYSNIFSKEMTNFWAASEERNLTVSRFQEWIFLGLGTLWNFCAVMVITGIFVTWFKKFRLWTYLIFGCLLRYLLPVLAFILAVPDALKGGVDFLNVENRLTTFQIFAFFSNFISTLGGVYCGYLENKESKFSREDDEFKFTLYGLSKKIWCLIAISAYLVIQFLIDLSIVFIYEATKPVRTEGRLQKLLAPLLLWALYYGAFMMAVEAISDKQSPHRRIKIVGVLVILPILINVIPLIRNRTWFF